VGERPNILFFHVDNLGFGELSCYSGGPFRGTWTRRIDAFAGQGFRLTNYAPVPPGAPLDFVPSEAQQDTQQPGSG
jgi:arylsulfatase A-like enzyme